MIALFTLTGPIEMENLVESSSGLVESEGIDTNISDDTQASTQKDTDSAFEGKINNSIISVFGIIILVIY